MLKNIHREVNYLPFLKKKLSHEGHYHINEMPKIRPGLNVALTSDKKSEKFHALIFHKTQKTSFWACFGYRLTQKL